MLMLYFSGTGNSKYIANLFGQKTGAKSFSVEEKRNFKNILSSSDTIGFCYPTYGGCVPKIMREFVSSHIEELKDKKLIIFCTQLMFSGDGARAFTELLPKGYGQVIYAEHFNMPNNLCNIGIFSVKNGDKTKKYIKAAEVKMDKVCKNIQKGKVITRGFNPVSKVLGKSQSAFWPKVEEKKKSSVMVDSDCINCSICVKKCPVSNLRSTERGIEHKNNCIICYRCVNSCPKKAITVLINKKPKEQYKGIK